MRARGVKRVKLDVTQRATRMRVYQLMSRVLVISGLLSYVDRQLQLSLLAHPVMHTANTVVQAYITRSLTHSLTHTCRLASIGPLVSPVRSFERQFLLGTAVKCALAMSRVVYDVDDAIAACSIQHVQTSENLAVPFSHRCFLPRCPIPRGQEGSSVIGLL